MAHNMPTWLPAPVEFETTAQRKNSRSKRKERSLFTDEEADKKPRTELDEREAVEKGARSNDSEADPAEGGAT